MNEGRAVTPEEITEAIQKLRFPKPKISAEEAAELTRAIRGRESG